MVVMDIKKSTAWKAKGIKRGSKMARHHLTKKEEAKGGHDAMKERHHKRHHKKRHEKRK